MTSTLPASQRLGDNLGRRSVFDDVYAFLQAQGVDVDQAMADIEHGRRRTDERTKETAEQIRRLASSLRRAKRRTALAHAFWQRGQADFSEITETRTEEASIDKALREACCNDEALISAAKKWAAR